MAKVRSVTYRHRKKGRPTELELMKPLHIMSPKTSQNADSLANRSPIPGISCRLLVKAGLRHYLLPCFERSFKPSACSESTGRNNPASPQYAETSVGLCRVFRVGLCPTSKLGFRPRNSVVLVGGFPSHETKHFQLALETASR